MGDSDDNDDGEQRWILSTPVPLFKVKRTVINHFRANLYHTKGASSSRSFEQTGSKTHPTTQRTRANSFSDESMITTIIIININTNITYQA